VRDCAAAPLRGAACRNRISNLELRHGGIEPSRFDNDDDGDNDIDGNQRGLHKPGRYAFSLGSLVAADGRSGAVTVHGSCSTDLRSVDYASAIFEASPSATAAESVAFQDHGAYPSSSSAPASRRGASSARHPAPGRDGLRHLQGLTLAAPVIWGDCVLTPSTTTTTLAPWCVTLMADAFIQAQSVVVTERHRDR